MLNSRSEGTIISNLLSIKYQSIKYHPVTCVDPQIFLLKRIFQKCKDSWFDLRTLGDGQSDPPLPLGDCSYG